MSIRKQVLLFTASLISLISLMPRCAHAIPVFSFNPASIQAHEGKNYDVIMGIRNSVEPAEFIDLPALLEAFLSDSYGATDITALLPSDNKSGIDMADMTQFGVLGDQKNVVDGFLDTLGIATIAWEAAGEHSQAVIDKPSPTTISTMTRRSAAETCQQRRVAQPRKVESAQNVCPESSSGGAGDGARRMAGTSAGDTAGSGSVKRSKPGNTNSVGGGDGGGAGSPVGTGIPGGPSRSSGPGSRQETDNTGVDNGGGGKGGDYDMGDTGGSVGSNP